MSKKESKVCVVGLGYIGLPTAAIIASRGYPVTGVDVDKATVDTINAGKIHIVEPDLDMLVGASVTTGMLTATTQVHESDIFLIAVPTPLSPDHKADLSYVLKATESISAVLKKGDLVILESTCPPGTTELVSSLISNLRPDLKCPSTMPNGEIADIAIAHCPERVLPGMVLQELVNNDRVIGGMTKHCTDQAVEFYKIFVRGQCIKTDAVTAELCKLTENAYRDVNIAFANELSIVCESKEIDVWELIKLANLHPRVNILQPGPGVGGHCIAVDPWFIVECDPDNTKLIQTARAVNDEKPQHVINKVIDKANKFKKPYIACFGLSFKANIDDLRESPSLEIAHQLAQNIEYQLYIVEPHIDTLPDDLRKLDNVSLVDMQESFTHADIILGLVDHDIFKEIPTEKLKDKIIIDTRGIWR